jgi:hypothetical protein
MIKGAVVMSGYTNHNPTISTGIAFGNRPTSVFQSKALVNEALRLPTEPTTGLASPD